MGKRRQALMCAIVLGLSSGPAVARPSAPTAPASDARCAGLAGGRPGRVEIVSTMVRDGEPVAGASMAAMGGTNAGPPIKGLPSFCRVVGHIRPVPGSDIGFELWMPRDGWDGRLLSTGSPGAAGSILYYMLSGAVRAGQVGLSNDGGHRGDVNDDGWAVGHSERLRDYGWRATHLSSVAARALIAEFYGRPADHAYFVGVSNGGRQALVEASRFPQDYDGIVAGAPVSDEIALRLARIWIDQAQLPPGAPIRPSQVKFLQAEVLRQCDRLDGQFDGLIDDPRRCHLNTAGLACGRGTSPECFTPAQLDALNRIYKGGRDRAGRIVAMPLLASGSEVADFLFGWDNVLFGHSKPLSADEPVKSLSGRTIATRGGFDFARDAARLEAADAFAGLDPTLDLRPFFARGGKLILWHGWADANIPPQFTVDYYIRALRLAGRKGAGSMRLFMVPGLQHGTGGKGADLFGQMTAPPKGAFPENDVTAAIMAWVETGRAPEAIIGRRHSSGATEAGAPPAQAPRERLICAYPGHAKLKPGANPDLGTSYACEK